MEYITAGYQSFYKNFSQPFLAGFEKMKDRHQNQISAEPTETKSFWYHVMNQSFADGVAQALGWSKNNAVKAGSTVVNVSADTIDGVHTAPWIDYLYPREGKGRKYDRLQYFHYHA